MRILILDDDDDLRWTFVEVVAMLTGTRENCLSLKGFRELLEHRDEALQTDLAMIDINLGANVPSGLDAETWLRENHYRGKVAFLTGHARSHPTVAAAVARGEVQLLEKPLSIEGLRLFLENRTAS